MSIRDLNWALEQPTGGPGSKVVLLALANYSNENHESYPSIERLARETDQSVATVKRRVSALIEQGLIVRTVRGGEGRGRMTNLYTLQHPDVRATAQDELLGLGLKNGGARAQDEGGYGSTVSRQPMNHQEPQDDAQTDLLGVALVGSEGSRRDRSAAFFAEFWKAYPKKVDKGAARKVWDRLVLTKGVDPLAIVAGCRTYARVIQMSRTERQFVKGPERWLNAGCWEDEVVAEDGAAADPSLAFTEGPAPEWVEV